MIEQIAIEHHIQKYILEHLMYQKYARFRDMRPKNIDTNLYSYHLKLLLKAKFITKTEFGYCLDERGLEYVDRVSSQAFTIRTQPKIITMVVIRNSNGEVLLYRRNKQPYIDKWTLPYGKVHVEDASLLAAAQREIIDKIGVSSLPVRHVGDCYIRTSSDGSYRSSTLCHVFYATHDIELLSEGLCWVAPLRLVEYDLAPAVEEIVTRTFFGDDHFFEEFYVGLTEEINNMGGPQI